MVYPLLGTPLDDTHAIHRSRGHQEVHLLDDYRGAQPGTLNRFEEPDTTCPFICERHRLENEAGKRLMGTAAARSWRSYLHTNKGGTSGRTDYRPIAQRE